MKGNDLRTKILIWRIKYIPEKNFILLAAGLTGILSGAFALGLKISVHAIKEFLTKDFSLTLGNNLYLAYPLIGLLLTVFMAKYVFKIHAGHSIVKILFSISKESSVLKKVNAYGNMILTSLTVGFGGSVGVEAPVVLIGSTIGSTIGQFTHFSYKNRTLLIGCGAAGAISAIFHAPIGGVIFALEVLLAQMSMTAFIPLLIASVTGSLVSKFFHMDAILLNVENVEEFSTSDFPFFLGMAVLSALISVYFTRTSYAIEHWLGKLKNSFVKAILGGVVLGAIILIFPPIYGDGFGLIGKLLAGNRASILVNSFFFGYVDQVWFIVLFIAALLLFKAIAASLTIGSGGSGGFFGPSLFMGALLGYGFATGMNHYFGTNLSYTNYTLVGMCGVLSGMLQAPLTAIFLIAEVTSGYFLFVPLMYVAAISFTIVQLFESDSMYRKQLIAAGDLVHHDRDKQVISMMSSKKLIEKDLKTVNSEATLADLIEIVKVSKRNIFPVLNDEGQFLGMITLDDIRQIMFDVEKLDTTLIKDLMHAPPGFVDMHDDMDVVMDKFQSSGAWNLPVTNNGKYVGFLSKATIFASYRKKLLKS